MMRSARLALLTLEHRLTPATFGVPWTDARHLTMSFAPDGTAISGNPSNLFQSLNAVAPTSVWQREVLRAVQSWASVANIDIGLVTDSGIALGTNPNLTSTRLAGDIRVAATDLASGVLAIGLPPDPYFADSWSGDVIYNSSNVLNPQHATIYSVFLHEFGHALGIDNDEDPASVMYTTAQNPATELSEADIDAIQQLYGERTPDRYDAEQPNETRATASIIGNNLLTEASQQSKTAPLAAAPIVIFGDVTSQGDVDYYQISPPSSYIGTTTFRLQTRGVSLLNPKLTVYSATGQLIGSSQSTALGGGIVAVRLPTSPLTSDYYVKVEGATSDEFGIGRYGLAVTYDRITSPAMIANIGTVLTGPFDCIHVCDTNSLFVNPSVHPMAPDQGTNDCWSDAELLEVTGAHGLMTANGTLESATDVDVYRVKLPVQTGPVTLTITARASAIGGIVPKAELVGHAGQIVPAQLLANGDGRFTIQATGLSPTGAYYVRITGVAPNQIGNYALSVLTSAPPIAPTQFQTVQFQSEFTDTLVVNESQVFHFLLSVTGPSAVRFTIESGTTLLYDVTVAGNSGGNARAVLLKPGSYTVRYRRIGDGKALVTARLTGEVISDPIGPSPQDSTQSQSGSDGDWASYYFASLRRLRKAMTAAVADPGKAATS